MIDLQSIPAPKAVEEISYEKIREELIAQLKAILPEWETDFLESDPAVKLLEVFAYREMLLRQRINDALKAVLLSFATGSDLDNLAAFYGVKRLPEESDEDFRRRILLSLERFSTAGPSGAYEFWALTADARVKDAKAISPSPGVVHVYVLSREGDGTPSEDLLEAVSQVLSDDRIRPLTDYVEVKSPEIIRFNVKAGLVLNGEVAEEVVINTGRENLLKSKEELHRLGKDFGVSRILRELHVKGVARVNLVEPVQDIVCDAGEAPLLENVELWIEGYDE